MVSVQESEGAATLTVPHQTWLCSFACHRDRSPSSRWRRTGEREKRGRENEADSQAQGEKNPKCQTRVKRSEKKPTVELRHKESIFLSLSLPADGSTTLPGWFYSPSRSTLYVSQLLNFLDIGPRQEVEFSRPGGSDVRS